MFVIMVSNESKVLRSVQYSSI